MKNVIHFHAFSNTPISDCLVGTNNVCDVHHRHSFFRLNLGRSMTIMVDFFLTGPN